MKIFVILTLAMTLSCSAFAAPSKFVSRPVLSTSTGFDLSGGKSIKFIDVRYQARCQDSDWASVFSFSTYDDSGDQKTVIGVGVAVPMDEGSCTPSRKFNEFSVRITEDMEIFKILETNSYKHIE